MTRSGLLLSLAVLCASCTTVKLNDDNTNSITYSGGSEVGQDLATRACRKAGERRAIIISTVNKDPSRPAGAGRQVTTFRCSSDDANRTQSGP